METFELSEACGILCPGVNNNDDCVGTLDAYSYLGVTLFILSEIVGYLDVEANGVVHALLDAASTLLKTLK